MSKNEIISAVFGDQALKGLCSKLCNSRDIKNDLWQEFILVICEKDEASLIEMQQKGYLYRWCSAVLKNMNYARIKTNTHANTRNQSLREISATHAEISNLEINDHGYDWDKEDKMTMVELEMKRIKANQVFVFGSIKDACEATGKTKDSVKWERSKIINELRKNFKREYIPSK